jgi:hypothetical protein
MSVAASRDRRAVADQEAPGAAVTKAASRISCTAVARWADST